MVEIIVTGTNDSQEQYIEIIYLYNIHICLHSIQMTHKNIL